MTHIPCGVDGWGHLVAVIDCYDRELIGFEFALRGRAREAEQALEKAYIKRFGTLAPYTPEQNGIIERFFRSLKEECVWQHKFNSSEEARRTITQWIDWYHTSRPHQALGYKSPALYHEQKQLRVA